MEKTKLTCWFTTQCSIFLLFLQAKTPIKASYMEGYKVKPSMRTVLIDWLVEVHGRFKLIQETLYLTVAIMDRFLQVYSCSFSILLLTTSVKCKCMLLI